LVVQHHATDPTYTTEYEYDDLDQLIRVTRNEDSALTIHYEYDSAGRLIRTYTGNVESTPGARAGEDDDGIAVTDTAYEYDLQGRLWKVKLYAYEDQPVTPEVTTYTYDENGRLLTEAKDDLSQANADRYTVYHYGTNNERTEQTGKTVYQGLAPGTELEDVENEYDLAGRLAIVTIDRPGQNDDETVTFAYDDDGNRVGQAVEDAEGTATTTYLIDENNLTGYSQTLEQTDRNASSQVVKKTTYVVGADVTGQYVTADETTTGAIFLQDGHGSTRGLYATASATGALLDAALVTAGGSTWTKTLTYDAYGNALGFDPATARTEMLYNGESFSARTGQQYLRARWYDPSSGRFGTLDPWAGDVTSPISPHKYLYASTSPVMNADPSGWASLLEKAIDIHHIVAKGAMKAGAVVARNVLLIFTIAVNSAANLVPLARGFHQHLHTIRYCNWVADLLSNAQSAEEVYEILAMIKETLRSGGPF